MDGPKFRPAFDALPLDAYRGDDSRTRLVYLPENTGGGGFYGYRVYAGFAHLLNEDTILFLDEDNWYDENHVSSVVEALLHSSPDVGFTFSLRKVCDKDGRFICEDNCESLGNYAPVWNCDPQRPSYLIDTSAYAFKRAFLLGVSSLWHRGRGGDRLFLNDVIRQVGKDICVGSGQYTLNYRLDGNPGSVTREFFAAGNAAMAARYPDGRLPWHGHESPATAR